MSQQPIALDDSHLQELLNLLNAPTQATEATLGEVKKLEDWLGRTLPTGLRTFLLTPVPLEHPSADLFCVTADFMSGLPDVDAFLEQLALPGQGLFLSAYHFLGLYPIGSQIQWNNESLYALAVLEPHTQNQLSGVMYFNSLEVGNWGATLSTFLKEAIDVFWRKCENWKDRLDEDEPFEVALDELRDCFALQGYNYRNKPPEASELPAPIVEAWDVQWRERQEQSRWWLPRFLRGEYQSLCHKTLPTPKLWKAERSRVATSYHDAMYWLLSHALLDNQEERKDCQTLAEQNPSQGVQTLLTYLKDNPDFSERYTDTRERFYAQTRETLLAQT